MHLKYKIYISELTIILRTSRSMKKLFKILRVIIKT